MLRTFQFFLRKKEQESRPVHFWVVLNTASATAILLLLLLLLLLQETGLGLARRAEQEGGSESSDDSNDAENGARGFFLADGTPNIRLRRFVRRTGAVASC